MGGYQRGVSLCFALPPPLFVFYSYAPYCIFATLFSLSVPAHLASDVQIFSVDLTAVCPFLHLLC